MKSQELSLYCLRKLAQKLKLLTITNLSQISSFSRHLYILMIRIASLSSFFEVYPNRNGLILNCLSALGAHFAPPDSATVAPVPTPVPTPVAPVPAPVPAKKLEAKGGDHGAAWDDGFYEDVRKIYVGQGDSGVSFIKFVYDGGKKLVAGDGHGKMSLFELDFPNEYIVLVEGCYDKVFGIEAEVVTMVKFKTNKRTSPPFGMDGGTTFVFEMKDHKIVGFHGKAGDYVHQVGVHVSPVSKS
ncbi:jacalin-related lectin 36-like [Brassica napus]|uniref:jacalin-related lectin 36-like n=1 Tax=Brassica napus TaxID=3708 RepID=UPI002078BF36|nr:jacalin-related lectin 36-like [Brassica napus]